MNMDQITGTCRLCLEAEKPSTTSMKDETFRARLAAVSSFMFEDNEQLPSGVCPECFERINQFYIFMETVRSNQKQLHLTLVMDEISQVSPSEQPECTVKKKQHSPAHKTAIMDEEVEMCIDEDPPAATKDEDEEVEQVPSSSSGIKKGEPADITDEDRLIKEFFSLKCETCSESFETFSQLKTHSNKKHDTQPKLQCCNKTFTFKRKMLYHINCHLKPSDCKECGKRFPDFPDGRIMKAHHAAKHRSSDEKSFKCDKCDKSFQTESHLRSHHKRHDRSGKDSKSSGAIDSHRKQNEELKQEDTPGTSSAT